MNVAAPTLYHASKHIFRFPSMVQASRNRENHPNGALGLWVAHDPGWIQGFGPYLYSLRVLGKVLDAPIDEFSKWCRNDPADTFALRRRQMLSAGISYLRIVETKGHSAMGVVIDFDAITEFTRVN